MDFLQSCLPDGHLQTRCNYFRSPGRSSKPCSSIASRLKPRKARKNPLTWPATNEGCSFPRFSIRGNTNKASERYCLHDNVLPTQIPTALDWHISENLIQPAARHLLSLAPRQENVFATVLIRPGSTRQNFH